MRVVYKQSVPTVSRYVEVGEFSEIIDPLRQICELHFLIVGETITPAFVL